MYSELTLTAADGYYQRFWMVSENVYERNKIMSNLIENERTRTGEYPLFEVHDVT